MIPTTAAASPGFSANGDLDASFNPGTGLAEPASASYKVSTYALLRLASGKALIGGYFSQYNGTTRNQLAQVLAGPADFNPGADDVLLLDLPAAALIRVKWGAAEYSYSNHSIGVDKRYPRDGNMPFFFQG